LRRLAAVIFAILTLVSAAVCAEEYSDDVCPKKPPADKRAQRWAGRWFTKGEHAAKQAKFQEALDAFLCSLHLSPHQNTVFNVAQLTNLVEDKAAATESIKKFREEHRASEFDDELSDLMVSLQKSQGIAPVEEPAVGPPPPSAAPPPESSSGEADGATPKVNALRGAGYSAITVAGATLVIGFILQGMAGAAKKDAEGASTIDGFQEGEDNRKGRQAGAVVMYVTTAALAGAGILMVVLGRPEDEAGGDDGAHVEVTAGPGGAAISGRF
jgi:hypothetical protein